MIKKILFLWRLAAPSLCFSCALAPDGPGEIRSAVLEASRPDPSVVSGHAQRVAAHLVAATPIAGARLAPGRYAMGRSGREVAATEGGRELLSLLVACALPGDVTLVAPGPGDDELEFPGGLGLAPRWLRGPLDRASREWVSACALSRLSGTSLAIPISLRGSHPGLRSSHEERDLWSLEEGAFFGDIFVDPDRPLPWFACRGIGDPGDPALADRVCTEEDPDRAGRTRCGMRFAGACPVVCRRVRSSYRSCRRDGFETDGILTAFLIP